MIKLKRAYEPASAGDGLRVLVDRLWPRGVTKAKAKIDLWLKDVAPSDALRKEFRHDPARWGQFQKAYRKELAHKGDALRELKRLSRETQTLTLVFSAADERRNNAVALRDFLAE